MHMSGRRGFLRAKHPDVRRASTAERQTSLRPKRRLQARPVRKRQTAAQAERQERARRTRQASAGRQSQASTPGGSRKADGAEYDKRPPPNMLSGGR